MKGKDRIFQISEGYCEIENHVSGQRVYTLNEFFCLFHLQNCKLEGASSQFYYL